MSKNYLKIQNVITEVNKVVVGQDYMIKRLLMGLFTQGHILLEGVAVGNKIGRGEVKKMSTLDSRDEISTISICKRSC